MFLPMRKPSKEGKAKKAFRSLPTNIDKLRKQLHIEVRCSDTDLESTMSACSNEGQWTRGTSEPTASICSSEGDTRHSSKESSSVGDVELCDAAATMGTPSPRALRGTSMGPQSMAQREAAIAHVARLAAKSLEELEAVESPIRKTRRCLSTPAPENVMDCFLQEEHNDEERLENSDSRSTNPSPSETLLRFDDASSSVVIFDWDDTLLPTWFIMNVVIPCTGKGEEEGTSVLTSDSPFHEALKDHARLIRNVLRGASNIARVAIVTLAARPWVTASAKQYLPGLDLESLLDQLGIRVYYARECVNSFFKRCAKDEASNGVNPWVLAKVCAMKKVLRKLYSNRRAGPRWNVVCIGDSDIERDAIQELLWCAEAEGEVPFCKTVKLIEDPSAEVLGCQLQVVIARLQRIIQLDEDLNLDLSNLETSGCSACSDAEDILSFG
mmetsp:Transcript_30828/g.69345  ORF Transcript_30828/g.69345 Transcript_30828/m.69345 type:complete len:440 (-) Transcript_30828:44-1363(-)